MPKNAVVKHTRGKLGRPVEFKPDAQQRRFVLAMAGLHMTQDEIRWVILNPKSNTPICKRTLQRCFADELAGGVAALKARIARGLFERIDAGEQWALLWGAKNILGFREDRSGSIQLGATTDGDNTAIGAVVTFHIPDPNRDD